MVAQAEHAAGTSDPCVDMLLRDVGAVEVAPMSAPRTWLGRLARWARGPLANAFRVTPASREALVQQMLDRHAADAAMYWLQLVLATAIATLGLALGSSVVVIGAMLIAPLMTPIVQLGMGLAVGSPVLVARSFARVLLSVLVVVAGATAITLFLPFHEMTPPIVARVSPTALDLLVAVCCALVAAFVTLTTSTSAGATAAGAAVGMALVPPLCVVGFGLGTCQLAVARGAALLFTASFSAIMLFSALTFAVFGFAELDLERLERGALPQGTARSAALASARRVLGGTSGSVLRVLLPTMLLAIVYVPLRGALEQVAWEVRARQQVRRELDAVAQQTVRSTVDVVGHTLRVQLLVVGTAQSARELERGLRKRLALATGTEPWVQVMAVPDDASMRAALSAVESTIPEPVAAPPELSSATSRIETALTRAWPAQAAGALLDWRVEAGSGGGTRVSVVHVGEALGAAATEVLAQVLSDAAGEAVTVNDLAYPDAVMSAAPSGGAAWLVRLTPLLDEVSRFDVLYACVGVPPAMGADAGPGATAAPGDVRSAVLAAVAAVPGGRARAVPDVAWTVRVQGSPCAEVVEATDAGADGSWTDGAIAAGRAAEGEARGDAQVVTDAGHDGP